jgi:hypothetical protein
VIEGKRGQLYFDGGRLCLIALDAKVAGMNTEQVTAPGGKVWTGSIWHDEKCRAHRDVKIAAETIRVCERNLGEAPLPPRTVGTCVAGPNQGEVYNDSRGTLVERHGYINLSVQQQGRRWEVHHLLEFG